MSRLINPQCMVRPTCGGPGLIALCPLLCYYPSSGIQSHERPRRLSLGDPPVTRCHQQMKIVNMIGHYWVPCSECRNSQRPALLHYDASFMDHGQALGSQKCDHVCFLGRGWHGPLLHLQSPGIPSALICPEGLVTALGFPNTSHLGGHRLPCPVPWTWLRAARPLGPVSLGTD